MVLASLALNDVSCMKNSDAAFAPYANREEPIFLNGPVQQSSWPLPPAKVPEIFGATEYYGTNRLAFQLWHNIERWQFSALLGKTECRNYENPADGRWIQPWCLFWCFEEYPFIRSICNEPSCQLARVLVNTLLTSKDRAWIWFVLCLNRQKSDLITKRQSL